MASFNGIPHDNILYMQYSCSMWRLLSHLSPFSLSFSPTSRPGFISEIRPVGGLWFNCNNICCTPQPPQSYSRALFLACVQTSVISCLRFRPLHTWFSPQVDTQPLSWGFDANTIPDTKYCVKTLFFLKLSHTLDRCSETYCFTGSAIAVQRPWSKLELSALLKGYINTFFTLSARVFKPATFRLLAQLSNPQNTIFHQGNISTTPPITFHLINNVSSCLFSFSFTIPVTEESLRTVQFLNLWLCSM